MGKTLEEIKGMKLKQGDAIELTFRHPAYLEKRLVYYVDLVKVNDEAGIKYSENKSEQHYREYFDKTDLINIKEIDKIIILKEKKLK